MTRLADELGRDGFAWVRAAFGTEKISQVANDLAAVLRVDSPAVLAGSTGAAYGARNLLTLWPAARTLLTASPLADLLCEILGDAVGVVQGLYFDKPPGHTWALPWHRDTTIAVREHRPSAAFRKPTVKAGVPHVEADETLLARMLTVRIHLDGMAADNGPLRVVPGSHQVIGDQAADAVTCGATPATCCSCGLFYFTRAATRCPPRPGTGGSYTWSAPRRVNCPTACRGITSTRCESRPTSFSSMTAVMRRLRTGPGR